MALVRKMPLWQADTITTVGRAPQPASMALASVAGLTNPLVARNATPFLSPWLVMKARQASPPAVRNALDTLVAVATGTEGLAPGSEVSVRMSRTPRWASLSRRASTPLSNAGLLLSPAIRTARQRSAGTPLMIAEACGGSGARASSGGAPVLSDVQAATRRRAMRRVLTFMASLCRPVVLSLRFGSYGAQRHVGVEPGHLLLAELAARTVPHRDVGALVEQRHGDRLEVAATLDLRRIEHALLDAFGQDADQNVADGTAAAADVGHTRGIEPADLAVGDQGFDPQPAVAHDVDPHEGRELGPCFESCGDHRLLANALQLGLGRGDDVVQELVLGLEVVVERALRQPAGLHDVAHRHHRVAALGELGKGRRADGFHGRPRLALGDLRGRGRHTHRLALAHGAPPAMVSTIRQASSAVGRTSLPDSAARRLDAVPSSERA